jgi:hypothetical protein
MLIPNDSGWLLLASHGINDRGEIVGTGVNNGMEYGVSLEPPK